MKQWLKHAVLGWLALAAVNFTAFFTGVYVPVCMLSLLLAGGLSVPGVTLAVVLEMLF